MGYGQLNPSVLRWCLRCLFSVLEVVRSTKRQRSASVMVSEIPHIHVRNHVLGVAGQVFGLDLLLDTQEFTDSSPVSPMHVL